MSLYNAMNGTNISTVLLLPMLGKQAAEYPRFRDCYADDDCICIYTRTGGVNREEYKLENQSMREMPGFVVDYDNDFDSTYAHWVFRVPDQWKADYDKIMLGNVYDVSDEYKAVLRKFYPRILGAIQ